MKKSIIAFGMAVLALTACNSAKNESELKVVLPDTTMSGSYIFLEDFSQIEPTVVDSILVKGNEGTIKMAADTNRLLTMRTKEFSAVYVPETGKQTITIDVPAERRKTYVANGTPLNKVLFDLLEGTSKVQKDFFAKVEKAREDGSINTKEVQDQLNEEYGKLQSEMMETYDNAYTANKNNALGAFLLLRIIPRLNLAQLDSLVSVGGVGVKNNQRIAKEREGLVAVENTSEGKMFTDIEGLNAADTTQVLKLSDFAGKGNYTLIDFWASWCGPCKAEMPHLKEAYAKYHKKGLSIVGCFVNDSYANYVKAAEELKLVWPQILDEKAKGLATYGIQGIPTLILFDKEGKIISRELRGEALLAKLAELYK